MNLKNLLFFMLAAAHLAAFPQNQELSKTIVVSGGNYSNPNEHVAVGYFDQDPDEYHVFDSIYTQSVQSSLVDGTKFFVAAGDSIVSYDLETFERIAVASYEGLNHLAVSGDKLLVSRQYPVTTESLLVLDKQTLELSTLIELTGEAAGIAVDGDSAYVAVPGAWGTPEGRIAVIDLTTESLSREVVLGTEAQGTKELFIRNYTLYAVNTHFSDYEANTFSVTSFDLFSGTFETAVLEGDYYGYYGNSVMTDSSLIVPVSAGMASYNVFNNELDLGFMSTVPAAIAYDHVAREYHLTTSDYATYGEYQVYNAEGVPISGVFETGISPEALSLQYSVSNEFTMDEVEFWVGEGTEEALLVIDWNDGVNPVSLAWGYRFDGQPTAEQMLTDISGVDAALEIEISGGFLNNIVYNSPDIFHSGIAGDPDYWGTWTRTASTIWEMNMGISEVIDDGSRFGCSYGFTPQATAPGIPVAAPELIVSTNQVAVDGQKAWISGDVLHIVSEDKIERFEIYNTAGQLIESNTIGEEGPRFSVGQLDGVFILRVLTTEGWFTKKLIK